MVMGFVNLQCSKCKGKGRLYCPAIPGYPVFSVICDICTGSGAVIVHTSAIGSNMHIGIDEASRANDETWATLWKVHDNGTLEVRDIGIVEAYRPED
jgi:methylase of polypeptide subunit release factors